MKTERDVQNTYDAMQRAVRAVSHHGMEEHIPDQYYVAKQVLAWVLDDHSEDAAAFERMASSMQVLTDFRRN